MPLSEAATLIYKQKPKIFKTTFNLYGVSFICTNYEAFTTFRAIFTRIRRANANKYVYILCTIYLEPCWELNNYLDKLCIGSIAEHVNVS